MTTIFRKRVCKSFLIALGFGKSNSPDAIQKVTVVWRILEQLADNTGTAVSWVKDPEAGAASNSTQAAASAPPTGQTAIPLQLTKGEVTNIIVWNDSASMSIVWYSSNCEFSDGYMWRRRHWAGAELLLYDRFCYAFNLWFQNTNLVSMIGTDFFSPNFCQTSKLDDATIILNGGKQIKPEK